MLNKKLIIVIGLLKYFGYAYQLNTGVSQQNLISSNQPMLTVIINTISSI